MSYFTLGQCHTHRINGVTLDKNIVVHIKGGRKRAFELMGDKWAFEHNEKPDMKYFPRGIVEIE